jgi:hypothetical protein
LVPLGGDGHGTVPLLVWVPELPVLGSDGAGFGQVTGLEGVAPWAPTKGFGPFATVTVTELLPEVDVQW